MAAALLLAQGMVGIAPAQATWYKFTFTSDDAQGYFIFDSSVKGEVIAAPEEFKKYFNEYDASVVEYAVDIGEDISERGTRNPDRAAHDEARTIVVMLRSGLIQLEQSQSIARPTIPRESPEDDEFVLFIPKVARQSRYSLSIRFRYPPDTFSGSLAQPTSVPNKALMSVHPYWDFPETTGPAEFEQEVQTSLEKY